ncbi:polyketide cyclase [Nibricoccus aquaticus]|uniref:Polyketide cyclase n=1 Tax=Nibricoccus aquaticus TaxID=2576891 RepID=A0A290QAF5_9BACT|nr:SRPBCC family protein [Nibricoccus aquaticus]ATC65675.1 polyketide cyclase [Nibricoccus aquaticus]
MFKKILICLAVIIVIFVVVVALQPSEFRIERSVVISAPAAEVFPHTNDLRKMQEWSPWKKMDPNATYTFAELSAGVGATMSWAGNSQAGEGRQTITESRVNEYVGIRLEFLKPFESVCATAFTLKPEGNQTTVTWSMSGENGFISKAFCLVMSQDKMIGEPFEEGLASLKALVEKR